MGAAICMKLSCLTCMHVCAFIVCMGASTCVGVGGEVAPTQISKNSISLELIKIIQFSLQILYL